MQDKIREALRVVQAEKGKVVFEDMQMLRGILGDKYPGTEHEPMRNLFKAAFNDARVYERFKTSQSISLDVHNLIGIMVSKHSIIEDRARMIVEGIAAELFGYVVPAGSAPPPSGGGSTGPPPPTGGVPAVGSLYKFGIYDWRVLDVQGGQALLLSEYVLGKRAYHEEYTDITWEHCSLRKYLNKEFLGSFPDTYRAKIARRAIANKDNPWYGTPGGNDTHDHVFLLSLDEVCSYSCFGNSMSNLAMRNILNDTGVVNDSNNPNRIAKYNGKASWWWLRSPGYAPHIAADVLSVGLVYVSGYWVGSPDGGVRPALWLNL